LEKAISHDARHDNRFDRRIYMTGSDWNVGPDFWDQSNFMQTVITSFRQDRNGRGHHLARSASENPIAYCPSRWVGAVYPKLPLIAGIFRSLAGLQFVQRFPDEIASA
jgi:hypothetical protein